LTQRKISRSQIEAHDMPSIGVNDDPIRRLVPVLPTSGGSSTMAGPKKPYQKMCEKLRKNLSQ
jgi:hypothetical protein